MTLTDIFDMGSKRKVVAVEVLGFRHLIVSDIISSLFRIICYQKYIRSSDLPVTSMNVFI